MDGVMTPMVALVTVNPVLILQQAATFVWKCTTTAVCCIRFHWRQTNTCLTAHLLEYLDLSTRQPSLTPHGYTNRRALTTAMTPASPSPSSAEPQMQPLCKNNTLWEFAFQKLRHAVTDLWCFVYILFFFFFTRAQDWEQISSVEDDNESDLVSGCLWGR